MTVSGRRQLPQATLSTIARGRLNGMDRDSEEIEEFVRQAAGMNGFVLDPSHLPGVVENFRRLAEQGEALMAFHLEEDEEPAPVFSP